MVLPIKFDCLEETIISSFQITIDEKILTSDMIMFKQSGDFED